MGFGDFLKSAGKAAVEGMAKQQAEVQRYYDKNVGRSDEELIRKYKETGILSPSSNEKFAIRKILKERGVINS